MKWLACFLLIICWIAHPMAAQNLPSIEGQVVFFYYKDLDSAARFYEQTLGFKKTFNESWVKIFEIAPKASVGLVVEGRGYHAVSEDKPAMLSIVTKEIGAWWEYIKNSDAKVLRELSETGNAPVSSFMIEDPGGYTLEFFQWNEQ